jgi:hypothetical protein
MKHLAALISFILLNANGGIAQTLYIGNGATVYVNRNNSTSTTSMLYVAGAIENSGTLNQAGSVQTTGSFTNNNTLTVKISGTTLGTNYDQLNIGGAVTLTGSTLTVNLATGYAPTGGETYTIIDASSLSGTFSTTNLPTLSSSLAWVTSYNGSAGTVILTVTSALPVDLLGFTAAPSVSGVQLDWQTAIEQNTQSFVLERSRDGKEFHPLSTQAAKGSNSDYAYLDKKPFSGINYYRLRIRDLDGQESFSKIVSAIIGSKTFKIKAYPSLVSEQLNIRTDGGDIQDFRIYNLAGQVVLAQTQAMNSQNGIVQLNLSHLPSATYLIWAKNTEGVHTTIKFVKQ